MRIMVYSLLWVMQDFVHQPYAGLAILCYWGGGGLGKTGTPEAEEARNPSLQS